MDKKCFVWVFLGRDFENFILIFEINTLKLAYFQNLTNKLKCLTLGAEIPETTEMFWNRNLKTVLSYLKSTPSNLSTWKIWQRKQNRVNLDSKICYFAFFGWNLKQYCHIWNQRPRICLIAKFGAKLEDADFKYDNSILKILAETYPNKAFLVKNIQIKDFWSQICVFLFSGQILQLDKCEGADF